MIVSALLGVLAGAILWLDRVFMFQFMLSRPVIIGALVGLVMGDVRIGLMVGASLELLWLNAPPVGAYLPNDETFCAAAAVPVGIIAGSHMGAHASAGLAILLCLPAALVGRSLDVRLRNLNEGLTPSGESVTEQGVSKAMALAVGRSFLLGFVTLSCCVLVLGAVPLIAHPYLPEVLVKAVSFVPFVCIIIGLASLASKEIPKKSHAGMIVLGMTLVLVLSWII